MHIVEPAEAARIMAIAAHPDDIESWCAGTLALAVLAGLCDYGWVAVD